MKNIVFLIVCFYIFSVNSQNIIYKPEIAIDTLYKKGIVPMNKNYKKDYPKLLSYLFLNENDTFNGIKGDFFNVDFKDKSNLNIMVAYFEAYGKYKNALIVLISLSSTSTNSINNLSTSVKSSKHGDLKQVFDLKKINIINYIKEKYL